MIKVLIKRLNQKVKIPSYKTIGSSGVDLEAFLENPIEIGPNKSALIPTGLAIAIPEDTEVQIRPRSGLAAKSVLECLTHREQLIVIIVERLKLFFLIMVMKNF